MVIDFRCRFESSNTKIMKIDIDEEIDAIVKHAHGNNPEIIETTDFRDGVRHAIEFLSSPTIKLTKTERFVVGDVVGRVIDAMHIDNESGLYEDRGDFVFRCSKADFAALKRAYKKL